jgi:hypothetical protein
MSFGLGKRRLAGLATVLAGAFLLTTGGRAYANDPNHNSGATIDQPGAVLVFPKVVSDSARDTIIQISNVMNITAQLHCFYINAQLRFPGQPPSTFNPRRWQETDFWVLLTRQQPTHWVASSGRPVDPSEFIGGQNSGIDPGAIPPVNSGFEGELRCFNVDPSGNPMGGNWFIGKATIRTSDNDVSSYNAIALRAGDAAGDQGNVVGLDEVGFDTGGHYTACPETLLFNFIAFDQPDPVLKAYGQCGGDPVNNPNCPVETDLTLVPCNADFENLVPGSVTVGVEVIDEFESRTSYPTFPVDCWLDEPLNKLNPSFSAQLNYTAGVLASPTATARLTSLAGGGLLGIAEETHTDSTGFNARAAINLQHEGALPGDSIVLSLP